MAHHLSFLWRVDRIQNDNVANVKQLKCQFTKIDPDKPASRAKLMFSSILRLTPRPVFQPPQIPRLPFLTESSSSVAELSTSVRPDPPLRKYTFEINPSRGNRGRRLLLGLLAIAIFRPTLTIGALPSDWR
jgi:hypothetical protein